MLTVMIPSQPRAGIGASPSPQRSPPPMHMKSALASASVLALLALPALATDREEEIEIPVGGRATLHAPGGAILTIISPEVPPGEQPLPVLINAGGAAFTDASGRVWQSDAGLVTGGGAVNRSDIPIDGTSDDFLFQTERYGPAKFAIPIAPGRYDVRLHYAETYFQGKGRSTGASVEGRALSPFDPAVAAGGARKAITRTLRDVSVTDGEMNISLLGKGPMVNAIEVAAANSLPADPIPEPMPDPEPDPGDTTQIPQSDQCNPDTVPALARERGMTTLAFCEDFSDPRRINLTSDQLGAGQTFVQNHIFHSTRNPPDRFTFSDGILTIRPTSSNYQGHLISTSKGGSGFQMRGGGWYAEARLRNMGDYTNWPGCTAFWSMDADHLYAKNTADYLEPDFYEWINGEIRALHYWKGGGGKIASTQKALGKDFDPKQFTTVAAFVEDDLSAYRWARNGKIVGSVTPSWMGAFRDFNGPVIIGSGPSCPIAIDFIRVWKR